MAFFVENQRNKKKDCPLCGQEKGGGAFCGFAAKKNRESRKRKKKNPIQSKRFAAKRQKRGGKKIARLCRELPQSGRERKTKYHPTKTDGKNETARIGAKIRFGLMIRNITKSLLTDKKYKLW